MREKPIYESSLFWVAFGAALAVIGGIFIGIGVADVGGAAGARIWADGWFRVGIGLVILGVACLWWSLTLYVAHRHAESHLPSAKYGGVEGILAQPSTPSRSDRSPIQQAKPSAPKEYIDLDLLGLLKGWATLTSAQEQQFVEANLRGKWARVSGQVADVRNNPPAVIFEIDRTDVGIPIQKSRLNVQMLFEPAQEASMMLLKKGDAVNIRGEVLELGRNQYNVPYLIFGQCELLKDSQISQGAES